VRARSGRKLGRVHFWSWIVKQMTMDFDSKPNRDRVFRETKPWHSGDCKRVAEYLARCGSNGATRHEIAEALAMPLSGVCGRVNTLLKHQRCYVVEGVTRPSPFGRPADVVFARV
jgi:hypothetical protein